MHRPRPFPCFAMLHFLPLLTVAGLSIAHKRPFVINTWSGPFTAATDAAFEALASSASALDAVEVGCATCERNRCGGTVGYGGSPDEQCETTLDALVMDGDTMNVGAVAGLRRVRDAVGVARHVLEHTTHSLLAGDLATRFAVENGFAEEADIGTDESRFRCEGWKRGNCQGNYRVNVAPDPRNSCGPYAPLRLSPSFPAHLSRSPIRPSHDTIAMVAISSTGSVAAGTSTNGAAHKVPGRVGDAPIAGSGAYVDSDVGGCGATGDGDVMMRFLPCYQAVESMRGGMSPAEAAEDAVARMARRYPELRAGLVVVSREGQHAGAAAGRGFSYSYRGGGMDRSEVVRVEPWAETRHDL